MIVRSTDIKEFATEERCFIRELLNSNASPEVSLAEARVESGVTTQLHVLDVDETYFILEGFGIVEINGETATLHQGDIAVIPKGATQRITNIGDKDLRFLCICNPRFSPESYKNAEDQSGL